ncbi:agmatinase [Effusibacillus lacus]|uniref:Agmatinase n=1 Tax=Effusibacillus lacus TaxID=1348429 RepID=A0A292YJ96_9BACL|nr:agmatinase [Effusibacillus lacus]TCS75514.1 agmatinase [Effusibacillus lacus]GAX88979.1 agmatinase [Effusibacillus lacus]
MSSKQATPFSVPNLHATPRFSGIRTFMRLPYQAEPEKKDFVILGAPFDTAASYRTGARFGPEAIRRISTLLRPSNIFHRIRPSDYLDGVDGGDIMVIPGNTQQSHLNITSHVQAWVEQGAVPITLGGDHSVSLPQLRAIAAVHGPLSLVHFDAHGDTWDEYWGEKYTHGTPFRRAVEEGIIDPSRSIQIGMRGTVYDPNDIEEARDLGFQVITADEVREIGFEETIRQIHERVGKSKAFLTFDIDFLDPVYAPGTGTPEIAGFTSAEAQYMLRRLTGLQFVGFDVVEVLPALDPSEVTALTAAAVAYEFISLLAVARRDGNL